MSGRELASQNRGLCVNERRLDFVERIVFRGNGQPSIQERLTREEERTVAIFKELARIRKLIASGSYWWWRPGRYYLCDR